MIVHIISSLSDGGAERTLWKVCVYDSDNIHVVICLTNEGKYARLLKHKNVDVICLNMKGIWTSTLGFYSLCAALKRLKPSVVQTWMYHGDLIGGLAAKLCGIKTIYWGVRNTDIPQSNISLTRLIIWVCSKLSDYVPTKIICCAQAAKKSHISLGYNKSKLLVIPNGYDLSTFRRNKLERKAVRLDLNVSDNEILVGSIARFDHLKDYLNLIKAAKIVLTTTEEVYFVFVGVGVDYSNKDLIKWIRETGFQNRFSLLGQRDDVVNVLSALDIFCLSSKAEGFPNVVAEAMAIEVPCVVTDVGDSATIVGETGIVVPPEDEVRLAEGLMKMIEITSEKRKELGILARSRIDSLYSINKVIKQYKNLYLT